MPDLFLSYAREDADCAARIASAFRAGGWSVWWDRHIPPGSAYATVIEEHLDTARCVVVLWSRHSVNSEWVRLEAAEGQKRKVLVPALLESVDKLPLLFRSLQTVDLSAWRTSRTTPDLEALFDGVTRLVAPVASTVVPPMPSPPTSPERASASLQGDAAAARTRATSAFAENDELVVPMSRKAMGFSLVLSLGFVLAGVVALGGAASEEEAMTSFLGLGFFAALAGYSAWRLLAPKPALVINRDGIFDNATIFGVGHIGWDEVADLRDGRFFSQQMLSIIPHDINTVFARLPVWKRAALGFNRLLGKPAINIPAAVLPIGLEQLRREVLVRFGY